MIEANSIRPSGIQRKVMVSPAIPLQTAGDFIVAYFPHAVKLNNIRGIYTVALTTGDETIDIGIAKDGDTVIDGLVLTQSGSAIGDDIDFWNTKGTNGGLIDIPAGTLLWLQTTGAVGAGSVTLYIEYIDNSN